MPPKHITQQIEAYLDNQLSAEVRHRLEEHVSICPACARRLFDAQRLTKELGPMMQKTLGRPNLPLALRYRVQQRIADQGQPQRFSFPWAASGRILNGLGTLAIVGVLIFSALTVVRSQSAPVDPLLEIKRASVNEGGSVPTPVPTPTLVAVGELEVQPLSSKKIVNTLGDTIDLSRDDTLENEIVSISQAPVVDNIVEDILRQPVTESAPIAPPAPRPKSPDGTIAFAIFNPATQQYETQLINADGSDHRYYPLLGISEPALSNIDDQGNQQIAYRAWGEPTTPRALISNNAVGDQPQTLTHFWEDAHPDWSPTEPRLIFASQRESDRYWRLYTAWEDGSIEKNLRREGKSPTFAPDGYRFAFESCDSYVTQNLCGLWIGDLEHSEYESKPFLLDPLAKSPDWSPTGEDIAYMANPDGNWDLYLIDSEGRNARRLTDSPAIEGLPTWSPDGEWLAYLTDDRDGAWAIRLLHVASGQSHLLVTLEQATFTPPRASPYDERHWWDEQLSWGN